MDSRFCAEHRKQPFILIFVLVFTVGAGTLEYLGFFQGFFHDSPKEPATEQPLKRPAFRPKGDIVTIKAGGISGGVTRSSLEQGRQVTPFMMQGATPLKVYMADGLIFVDASLLTDSHSPPFEVKRNLHENLPPNWDANSTETILEVVNNQRIPMLQIIYPDESTVEVNGVFRYPDSVLIVHRSGTRAIRLSDIDTIAVPLKRIFKYPSYQFPGTFNDEPKK